MNSQEYISNAVKTESVPASLEINQAVLYRLMQLLTASAEIANQLKRKLYYGKPLTKENLLPPMETVTAIAAQIYRQLPTWPVSELNEPIPQAEYESLTAANVQQHGPFTDGVAKIRLDQLNIRLLHSALGIFSESGELLEALQKQFETGELDKTNFGEEQD